MRSGRTAVLLPALAGVSVTAGMIASSLLHEGSPWATLLFTAGAGVAIIFLRLAMKSVVDYERHRAAHEQASKYEHLVPFSRGYLTYHANGAGWSPRAVVVVVWACCTPPVLFVGFLWVYALGNLVAGVTAGLGAPGHR